MQNIVVNKPKVDIEHYAKIVRIRSYSAPHFSRIFQSEFGKMRTRITPNTDTFHAVEDTAMM